MVEAAPASVAERVRSVRDRIAQCAREAGRAPEDITLVAVCKKQPLDRITAALEAGVEALGENTAQGLRATAPALREQGRDVRWHFVGRLQKNKINHVLREGVALIHSVDSESLASALSKRVGDDVLDVLVQVNIGDEVQKGGVEPGETLRLCRTIDEMRGLRLRGLMGVPPAGTDPRPYFEQLATLYAALREECSQVNTLSMGMSADFDVAISCGATMVRVGTSLFGERPAQSTTH